MVETVYYRVDGDNGTGWYYKKYWLSYGINDVGPFEFRGQAELDQKVAHALWLARYD